MYALPTVGALFDAMASLRSELGQRGAGMVLCCFEATPFLRLMFRDTKRDKRDFGGLPSSHTRISKKELLDMNLVAWPTSRRESVSF